MRTRDLLLVVLGVLIARLANVLASAALWLARLAMRFQLKKP